MSLSSEISAGLTSDVSILVAVQDENPMHDRISRILSDFMGYGFCQIMNGKKRAAFCKRRKHHASLASSAGPSGLISLLIPRTSYLVPYTAKDQQNFYRYSISLLLFYNKNIT